MKESAQGQVPHLGNLQTEAASRVAKDMDSLSTLALCQAFHQEESQVPAAIAPCLRAIAGLIDEMLPRLRAGGRLIYVGAGNSGRVAQMDCAEIPVTFSVDAAQFLAVIAGGPRAVLEAVEGAEDAREDGEAQMDALQLLARDTVIGISASGRTPFVMGALQRAMSRGALTAAVTNVQPAEMATLGVDHCVTALVGPEIVTGSTRLKAGSCAKQILNMISTCAMVRLGKTYRGLMVDVRVKNEKLRARGRRIVRQVCQGRKLREIISTQLKTDIDVELDDAIDALIVSCGGNVKLACAVGLSGLSPPDAARKLQDADSYLSRFILQLAAESPTVEHIHHEEQPRLFLAIDGGGTKCAVSISTVQGVVARAITGPCNPHSALSFADVVEQIRAAVFEAISSIPEHARWNGARPRFTKVWAGIAGFHHMKQASELRQVLESLFGVSDLDGSLQLTCDTSLLSCCVAEDDDVEAGVALIAGTGSVAVAFKKTAAGKVVRAGRTGGWGHMVGDEGSAFDIGKRALQSILRRREQSIGDNAAYAETDLEAQVLSHFNCDAADLLSTALSPAKGSIPRLVIAGVAQVVTQAAFRPANPSPEALDILDEAAEHLVSHLQPLVGPRLCEPGKTILIMSGALMGVDRYRDLVLQKCSQKGLEFQKIRIITDASGNAASYLSRLPGEEKRSNCINIQGGCRQG
ncbi:hypothetical protein MY11210_008424 [Beauveria gryllotalpidicola]